jgi:tetratricopeptide (TPR) repeat protein
MLCAPYAIPLIARTCLSRSNGVKNVLPWVNKALGVFQWKQDMPQAEDLCKEALEMDPECDVAIATLAQLSLQQGKISEAIDWFEKSAKLARTEVELTTAITCGSRRCRSVEFGATDFVYISRARRTLALTTRLHVELPPNGRKTGTTRFAIVVRPYQCTSREIIGSHLQISPFMQDHVQSFGLSANGNGIGSMIVGRRLWRQLLAKMMHLFRRIASVGECRTGGPAC